MKIKGTRVPYRLIDGYVEKYGKKFKKELSDDYPYISQEHLDDYLINLYEQNKLYWEFINSIKTASEQPVSYDELLGVIQSEYKALEESE